MEDKNLRECLRQIEEKVGKGSCTTWTDGVFAQLSDEIQSETKVVLSKNTLKRLFGKMRTPNDYHPQRETRNALAKFAGYVDWNHFVGTIEGSVPLKSIETNSISSSWNKTFVGVSVFLFLIVAGLFFIGRSIGSFTSQPFTLNIKNPIDTVPFTLVSKYDSSYQNIENCILSLEGQFNLSGNSGTYTEYIELPTYTWLYVKEGNDLIFSKAVHALSRGWEAFYHKKQRFTKVPIINWQKPGMVSFNKMWFVKHNLDTSIFDIQFRNSKNFELDGDNFTFETRVFKHPQLQTCTGNMYKIFGEGGHIEVALFPPYCAQHNFINLNEVFLSGRTTDLTSLGQHIGEYSIVRIQVINKNMKLFLNGRECFSKSYTKSVGQIKAFIFSLSNFNDIDYIKAWDAKGKLVENFDFD